MVALNNIIMFEQIFYLLVFYFLRSSCCFLQGFQVGFKSKEVITALCRPQHL